MRKRLNADASYRKVERQVTSYLTAVLQDGPQADAIAQAQLPEIIELYGKELRRRGSCKNKICVQYRLLADMIRLEAELPPEVSSGCFGANRILSHLRRGKEAPNNWLRLERHNLAKAIVGGLDRESAALLMLYFHFDAPITEWSPEGADLNNVLDTWDTPGSSDVVLVYRQTNGRMRASRIVAHVERYEGLGPLVWEDESVEESDFPEEFYEQVALEHGLTIEYLQEAATRPQGFAQLAWDYCIHYGCQTYENYDKESFRRRFALELAFEKRGWLRES